MRRRISRAIWLSRHIAKTLRIDWSLVPELERMLASSEMMADVEAEALCAHLAERVANSNLEIQDLSTAFGASVDPILDPRAAFGLCESPIEELFLLAMLSPAEPPWPTDNDPYVVRIGNEIDSGPSLTFEEAGIDLWQQETVDLPNGKTVRLDFSLHGELEHVDTTWKVAIELDGHEFHDRTKEQAARDRSRDRELSALGWTVLRFTGSEIWKDAKTCAMQALSIAWGMHKEHHAADAKAWQEEFARIRQHTDTGASDGPMSSSGSKEESAQP